MDRYLAIHMLIEKRELSRGKMLRRGEKKSLEIYKKGSIHPDMDLDDGLVDNGDNCEICSQARKLIMKNSDLRQELVAPTGLLERHAA